MQRLYDFTFRLLAPFLRWHLARRARRGKEIVARLCERFGFAAIARPPGPLVWLHGASNGESLSLLPMIGRLRALPQPPAILVTTGTVGSAALMAQRLPPETEGGCIHQFIPLDHPAWARRFLDHWRPDGVLWAESELWPGILSQVRARRIPAALLNARLSADSGRRWLRFPRWARAVADTFSIVAAQTPDDARRWERLGGAARPQLLGNLKFVAAPLPCDADALALLQGQLGNRPLWLFASAHPGEELVARAVHLQLQENFPGLLTVIVPRHTGNGARFTETLQAAGLQTALRSGSQPVSAGTQIYIADTMGELGLFYRLSKLAVVGGSFVPVGGHNPIEPARLGSFPLYGPQMFKQQAICAAFEAAGAAQPVADAAALAAALAALLKNPAELQSRCAAAMAVCARQAESGPLIWNALAPWRAASGLRGDPA